MTQLDHQHLENKSQANLHVHGGLAVRTTPWPKENKIGVEEKQAVMDLFDQAIATGQPIGYGGEQEEAYCQAFADFLGGGYADGVNSGTSAIWVALRALEIEPFTEVIVAPTSDQGSFMPVVLNNCIPIPADSRHGSHNTGPQQIEQRITDRTSAIIVVHLSGDPVDMDPVMAIAKKRGIKVIEDCSQAHGATYKGRKVGSIGDVSTFSTMFSKHHTTGGQGGVVFTKDENLYWKIRQSADRGKGFPNPNPQPGVRLNVIASHNMNMDEISAAIGRVQLEKLPDMIASCQRFAANLDEGCQQQLQAFQLEPELVETKSTRWRTWINIDIDKLSVDIQTIIQAIRSEGVPVDTYYYPLSQFVWYQEKAVFGSSGYPWTSPLYKGDPDQTYPLPNLKQAGQTQFRISSHPGCGDREVEDILLALKKIESAYLID